MRQIHRVAFIRVQMHFQLRCGREAHQQVFEHRRAGALDPQVHAVAVLDAVIRRVGGAYVDVALVADDAACQLDHARGAEEVVVVADHTKIGRQALAYLCELSAVDTLIVDDGITPEQRELVGSADVQLILAEAASGTSSEGARS